MNQAAWYDTTMFAPRPIDEIEREGLQSRPDMQLVPTRLARVRMRAQILPGRPAIVIIPDGPNTIEHHDVVFEAFSGRYSVVAIEPPGLGFSYARHPDALGFEGTVAAVEQALRTLPIEQFVLSGSCVQAYLAIALAVRLDKQALGVIASQATDLAGQKRWTHSQVDPTGLLSAPHVGQQAWLRASNRESMSIDAWYKIAAGPDVDIKPWQDIARSTMRCGACYGLASLIQGWFGEVDIPVPTWNGPAVVLFGMADKTHQRSGSRIDGLTSYLPKAEIRRLDRIGHFPDLESLAEFSLAVQSLVPA